MTKINAILAHDKKYGIGKEGKLPWPHNKTDMKWFREHTKGHVIVMGRKTWESLGSTRLPDRVNVVVTSKVEVGNVDLIFRGMLPRLFAKLKVDYPDKDIWVIGGAEIYEQTIPHCDALYITEFPGDFDCDAFVYTDSYADIFKKTTRNDKDGLKFKIMERI